VSHLRKTPRIPLEALLKPIGRIESLCPPLRFRMLLHGDSANKLTFVIIRCNLPDGL
jgi:hypothetical protein